MGDKGKLIRTHEDLDVYKLAFAAALEIFEISRHFPKEETYSLTDQIRRSSRAVCANISEAWRRRRYQATFALRLNDAEAEAAETQTWLRFAENCMYVDHAKARDLHANYDRIIGKLVRMIVHPGPWTLPVRRKLEDQKKSWIVEFSLQSQVYRRSLAKELNRTFSLPPLLPTSRAPL